MDLQDVVENEYFEWLYNYVCKNKVHDKISYKKLFATLHDTEFIFSIPNDVNRAEDGIYLRYTFKNYFEEFEGIPLPCKIMGPCSVLEMLVALSIKCEENIMDNPEYGDRTAQWFWMMMSNLGLSLMTDDIYDRDYVKERIDIFLNREYSPEGKGGLFYIKDCSEDLRNVEIWAQLCWYLDRFV